MSDPLQTDPPRPTSKPLERTIEEWAKAKGTPDWLFAGAKAGHRWAKHKVLTEAQYDTAIAAAGSVVVR